MKFARSVVQVPFRIFTKEEEKKDFKKQWQDPVRPTPFPFK